MSDCEYCGNRLDGMNDKTHCGNCSGIAQTHRDRNANTYQCISQLEAENKTAQRLVAELEAELCKAKANNPLLAKHHNVDKYYDDKP